MEEINPIPRLASECIVLGNGIGRCVNQGTYRGVAIAIKRVISFDLSPGVPESVVQNELKFLSRLRHYNLVCQIVGYYLADSMLGIVMALAENGDMQKYLCDGHLAGDWGKKNTDLLGHCRRGELASCRTLLLWRSQCGRHCTRQIPCTKGKEIVGSKYL